MSEYTPCNFCSWRTIKKQHPKYRLVPDPGGHWPGGMRVVDEHGNDKQIWFAEVPAQCTGDHL